MKKWRRVFPGASKKKQRQKRRASLDGDAIIAQFKKMAEETMKMPRIQTAEQ